jgi:putative ABC transport system substrate-binding protein
MSARRRDLLAAIVFSGVSIPFALAAQRDKVWRIGGLSAVTDPDNWRFDAFKQQLKALGHVEGKTYTIDFRSAEGNYGRLPDLAAELVRSNVDLIVAFGGTPPALAAKRATTIIPIVFIGVADPVGQGIVPSLSRPGGNVTGISNQYRETSVKTLELLKELVPSATHIAILSNPTNASLPSVIKDLQSAARQLQVETSVVHAGSKGDFEKAFAEAARMRVHGLIVMSDSMFVSSSQQLAALAAQHRLPSIGGYPIYPESGGLICYGANRVDFYHRASVLVDKILKGAKPGDLPVEQPTQFDLVVNLQTAKALGITIPQTVLVRATKVIR